MAETPRQRIDKWLWFARIVKTRSLAARLVEEGRVRLNRNRIAKPAHEVVSGDVVTLSVHGRIRVLQVKGCAARRSPAAEAQRLYDELAMPKSDPSPSQKEDASRNGTC